MSVKTRLLANGIRGYTNKTHTSLRDAALLYETLSDHANDKLSDRLRGFQILQVRVGGLSLCSRDF
ncbi:MAG: hypothetical protein V7L09_33045 [Nostoc sp.]|uniref:hypothetical protein n=1 Tax=Nostoc sp. TaxID=1180 RepID=UPI002FF2B82A